MAKCKITVIKVGFDNELVKLYRTKPLKPCHLFKEGDIYYTSGPHGIDKPEDFKCGEAWDSISRYAEVYAFGGKVFGKESVICCCPDGLRPVVFKIEKLSE